MTDVHESLTYDIDPAASLRDLYVNPTTRWFAAKQAAKLIARGVVAAGEWNELLHPRGRDGKFINKFGFVRWFDVATGKWRRAMVKDIGESGTLFTVTTDTKESVVFPHEAISKKVYSAAVVKAQLALPDVSGGSTPGWTKTGGQGGSNLGGFYTTDDANLHMGLATWGKITKEHSLLSTNLDKESSDPQISWMKDHDPYIWADFGDGVGWHTVLGEKLSEVDTSKLGPIVKSEDPDKTLEAWDKIKKFYATFAKDGTKFYVKKGKTDKHVANEVLANRLYELAGVPVAEVITDASQTTIASKLVPFVDEKKDLGAGLSDVEAMDRLKEDFVVDAWLANWDVVGLGLENVQIVDGVPYRIDAGGAISYRAQGSPKGKAFGTVVGELESLLDPSVNSKSAKAFKGITPEQMLIGAQKVASIDPDAVDALVISLGLEQDVADTLKARRQYIIDKFGIADPWHTDPHVDVDNLPKASAPDPLPMANIDDAPGDIAPVTAPPLTSTVSLNGKIFGPASMQWVDGEYTKPSSYFFQKISDAVEGSYFPLSDSFSDMNNKDIIGGLAVHNGSLHLIEKVDSDGTVTLLDVVLKTKSTATLNKDNSFHFPVVALNNSPEKKELLDAAFDGYGAYITELAMNPAKLNELILTNSSDYLTGVEPYHEIGVIKPSPKFLSVNTKKYQSQSKPLTGGYNVAGPKGFLGEAPDLLYSLNDNTVYGIAYQEEVDIGTIGTLYVKKNPSDASPTDLTLGGNGALSHYVSLPTGPLAMAIFEAVFKSNSQTNDPEILPTVVPEETAKKIDNLVEKAKVITEAEVSVETVVGNESSKTLDITNFILSVDQVEMSSETKEKIKSEFAYAVDGVFTADGFKVWAAENLTPEETELIIEQYDYAGNVTQDDDYPYISKQVSGKKYAFLHPSIVLDKSIDLSEAAGYEDFDGFVQRLIGKVAFVTSGSGPSTEVGMGTKVQGLVFIKEYKNGKFFGATASGKTISVPFDASAEKNSHTLHILGGDITVDAITASPKPVMKKTGEIMYGGVVVGTWEVSKKYYSNAYKYTINPEFTISGEKISGLSWKKTNLAALAQLNLIPKPASVAKKASASTVTKTIKEYVNKSIPGDPKLYNGEKAELGVWVASTKGGGGFVGKIVGWPNQETHPGLAIAVGKDGVQKIVSLKTQKSVPEPPDLDDDGIPLVSDIPNAYAKEEFKLGDGKFPVIGQRVKSGKSGSEIEGIITNINVDQGWVYILQDNGKKTSKTFSVTTVLEEPHLIWDADIPIEVQVEVSKPSPPKKPKKIKAPTYVPDDGSLYEQSQSVKDEWVAKGLALTKDGLVPETAMHVVLNDGSFGIVVALPNPYSNKPNSMGVYNIDKGKMSYVSPANVEVNHTKQLAGHLGQPVKKIAKITNLGPYFKYSNYDDATTFPEGTKLYVHHTKGKQIYHGDFRNVVHQSFFAITPDGTMYKLPVQGSGVSSGMVGNPAYTLKSMLKPHAAIPGALSLVGVFSADGENVHVNPPVAAPHSLLQSPFLWYAPGTEYVPPAPKEAIPTEPNAPSITLTPDASKAAPAFGAPPSDAPNAQTDVVDTPSNVYVPTGVGDLNAEDFLTPEELAPSADDEGLVIIDPEKVDIDALPSTVDAEAPVVVDQGSLDAPLPSPTPQKPASAGETMPPPPQATSVGADMSTQTPVLEGTKANTIASAASKMLGMKDSTAPGTGSSFAVGDSDLVDDMEMRFSVMKEGNKERLRLRFRLREDNSEDFVTKVIGATGGLLGVWKKQDSKYPVDFKPGDAIAVRIGTFTAKGVDADGKNVKQLKPDLAATTPNARIISYPEPVGKSPGPNGEGMYLTYRVKVQTSDGSVGELDLQMRPSATLLSYEWDPNAPDMTTDSKLSLLPTAAELGWVDVGPAHVQGVKGTVQIDEAGKWTPSGTIKVIHGDKGRKLRRKLGDGTTIEVNGVHPTVSGIGNLTPRRSNFAGEVTIDVPLDGRDEQEILDTLSESLEFVGIPPEKQSAPSNEKLVELALGKLVSNYHPKYSYRDKPISGPDDVRVTETLAHMSQVLKKTLGRPVTLDDVRIHTSEDGTMRFMLSPEVGIAIAKKQKVNHHEHGGAASFAVEIFAGTHPGLMATETRWSVGITTTGQSSHQDLLNGSGDRVYTRGRSSVPGPGNFSVNAAIMAMSMETYTNIAAAGGVAFDASGNNSVGSKSDAWGRRGGLNKFIEHTLNAEAMTKRKINPEMVGLYITKNNAEKESVIKKLKSRGVTHIGSRPVENVIVTPAEAIKISESPDWLTTGMDIFDNDIPITALFSGASAGTAPAGAGAAV